MFTAVSRFLFATLLLFVATNADAESKIRLSRAFWDFGTVKEGTVLRETLTISNRGTSSLEVHIRPSCECLTVTDNNAVLPPGTRADSVIKFDTADSNGKRNEYLFLETNDPQNPTISWLIEGTIIAGTASARPVPERAGDAAPMQPDDKTMSIPVEIYSTPGCSYCRDLKERLLPRLAQEYGVVIVIKEYPLNVPGNYERMIALEKKYGNKNDRLPVLFAGGRILGGKKMIAEGIEKLILSFSSGTACPSVNNAVHVTGEQIAARINSLAVLPLLAAGLADGINPCAFAGIIFLVAYLGTIRGRPVREVFWTGLMFIAGIFVVYFLIGIGITRLIAAMNTLRYVSRIVYFSAGTGTLVLAYLSFRDYLSLSGASARGNVTLQLPAGLKAKIFTFIENYSRMKYLIPSGFILGAGVSFLEFFCTGQIYLPTIMYMVRLPELQSRALVYLALYSFLFVLPLIVVFLSLLVGLKSGRLKGLDRSQMRWAKLLASFIFLLLAILLFAYSF